MKKIIEDKMFLEKGIRRVLSLLLILSLTIAPVEYVNASPSQQPEEAENKNTSETEESPYAENEMLIVYDDAGVSDAKSEKIQEKAEEVLDDLEIEVTDEVAEPNESQGTVVAAKVPEELEVEEAIEQLMSDENVSYAQPNFIYQALDNIETKTIVNDVYAGNDYSYYLSNANVLDGWDIAKTKNQVTVAVLDTGCRLNHEDLKNNILKNYAYDSSLDAALTAESAPNGGDATGHGTHVCGLIAAEANNGKGIAGTSYNANILPIKVFNNDGGGATTETMIRAMEYCRKLIDEGKVQNLRVMNMSVGYYPEDYGGRDKEDGLLEQEINLMTDEYDVLCVCSGGNGDTTTRKPRTDAIYPADFESCLSVTALTKSGGNCTWSDYNMAKDISAPGESIVSTYYNSDSSYAYMSGSSMAAPIVSGICALLWAADSSLTVDEVVAAVEETADKIPGSDTDGRAEASGSAGAINAAAALTYVTEGKITNTGGISIKDAEISDMASCKYTGGKITPQPTVTLSGKVLRLNLDYKLSYSNNINVGTGTVIVEGMGDYIGSARKTFKIIPRELSECAASLSGTTFSYTNQEIRPMAVVRVNGNPTDQFKYGTDYTISYSDNIEVGTASALIKATGDNCTGSITATFNIAKADVGKLASSLSSTAYTYNGKARKPSVTVKNGSSILTNGKDYTVSYSQNTKVGTATVKITGKGSHYTGTAAKTFKINPKGTSISKLTKKSKGFTVKWKKQATQTTGYQIQYSTSSKFKSAKTVTVSKTKTTSKKVSKLKKKKTYYVRVRTYRKVNGKKYYSGWSKTKKVKTK